MNRIEASSYNILYALEINYGLINSLKMLVTINAFNLKAKTNQSNLTVLCFKNLLIPVRTEMLYVDGL